MLIFLKKCKVALRYYFVFYRSSGDACATVSKSSATQSVIQDKQSTRQAEEINVRARHEDTHVLSRHNINESADNMDSSLPHKCKSCSKSFSHFLALKVSIDIQQ